MLTRCLPERRRGFTLAEVLVVIVLTILLAAAFFPSLTRARISSRRAECLNNMRQLGLALLQIVSVTKHYPHSGTWNVATGIEEWRFDASSPPGCMPTSRHENPGPGMKYSWCIETLPYLDRGDIHEQWDFTADAAGGAYMATAAAGTGKPGNVKLCNDTSLKILTCPEDITTESGRGNLSYVVNGGFSSAGADPRHYLLFDDIHRRNLSRMGLMFLGTTDNSLPVFQHTLETVRDGTSVTVMLSENVNAGIGKVGERINNWGCPHPNNTSFFVNGAAVGIGNPVYDYSKANARGPASHEGGINGDLSGKQKGAFPYPNSFHEGGVNIVMCDGSTRFLAETIDPRIWARIVTPDGGRLSGGMEDGTPPGNRQRSLSEECL